MTEADLRKTVLTLFQAQIPAFSIQKGCVCVCVCARVCVSQCHEVKEGKHGAEGM